MVILSRTSMPSEDITVLDDGTNSEKFFHDYLTVEIGRRFYACVFCGLQLAIEDDIESRNYVSNARRAFMISKLINIYEDESTNRWAAFNSGEYYVCDVHCNRCYRRVATKYLEASDTSYSYKVGKYLVSRQNLCKERMCNDGEEKVVSESFRRRCSSMNHEESDSLALSSHEVALDAVPHRPHQRTGGRGLRYRSKSCVIL